jgi:DNA mismatch endonuclease (patch repair protein)
MQAVKSKDTAPEMVVRRALHAAGFRFRLHRRDLPGCPDLTFPGRRKVIFVHGCFWHGHDCARGARVPKTNTAYWVAKVARNQARDEKNCLELERVGWKAMVIWECATRDAPGFVSDASRFLLT